MIAWEWLKEPGLEVAQLSRGADGAQQLAGHVVAGWESQLMELRYTLRCDAGWRFNSAEIRLQWQGTARTLSLTRGPGGWRVDGQPRPDLAAAEDIDLMGTPLTNTLPIQRLAWQPGQSREFVMAYVRLPDLAVLPVSQRYTALAGDGRRFRYEGLHSGFTAEISVDAQGLVLDYPPFWRRLGREA
jgi:hypothetical protein